MMTIYHAVGLFVFEEPPAEEKIVAIPQSAAMPCDALGMATIFMLYLVDICMFNTCIAYILCL